MLFGILIRHSSEMALELLDQLLLVPQLILDHIEILDTLLQGSVVFCSYFQFDIVLL